MIMLATPLTVASSHATGTPWMVVETKSPHGVREGGGRGAFSRVKFAWFVAWVFQHQINLQIFKHASHRAAKQWFSDLND